MINGLISVKPHVLRYCVVSAMDGEAYLIMHEELHKPDLQLCDILNVILEGFSM